MALLAALRTTPRGAHATLTGILLGTLPRSGQAPAADPIQPPPPLPLLLGGAGKFRLNGPFFPNVPVCFRIFGVTKDSAGSVLASCTVDLFRTVDNAFVDSVVSDAGGNYEFRSAGSSAAYYVVAYKAGSPDVAGTTVNTLVGV